MSPRRERSWPRATVASVRRASSPQPAAPSHQARTAVASTVRPAASVAVSIRAFAGSRLAQGLRSRLRDPALPTHRSVGGATTSWSCSRAWCTACRSIRTADSSGAPGTAGTTAVTLGAEPLVGAVQRDLENVADVEVEAPGGGRREDDGEAGPSGEPGANDGLSRTVRTSGLHDHVAAGGQPSRDDGELAVTRHLGRPGLVLQRRPRPAPRWRGWRRGRRAA